MYLEHGENDFLVDCCLVRALWLQAQPFVLVTQQLKIVLWWIVVLLGSTSFGLDQK